MASSRLLSRRAGLLYFALGLVGLSLAIWVTSASASVNLSSGLWIQVAVLSLLSAFVLETRFTSGATATANAVAVGLVVLAAVGDGLDPWWWSIGCMAGLSLVLNVMAYGGEGSAPSALAEERRRAMGRLAIQLGEWRALLLPTLALSLATYNEPLGTEWAIGIGVGAYSLLISSTRPHELTTLIASRAEEPAGQVTVLGLFPPTGILVAGDLDPTHGDVVTLTSEWGSTVAIAVEPTVIRGGAGWWFLAPSLRSLLPREATEAELETVRVESGSTNSGRLSLVAEEFSRPGTVSAGVLTEGSSVRELRLDVLPETSLRIGEVVWTRTDRGRCYWQVAGAAVKTVSWVGDTRRSVQAEATQIGTWRPELVGFEIDDHAPRPDDLVYRSRSEELGEEVDLRGYHRIGSLVGSDFPVALDLARLGRHHAAILGTTGTGKTHLAFRLIEGFLSAGTRVVCVDLTDQYSQRFSVAPVLHSLNELTAFYEDSDQELAVLTPENANPIKVLNNLARSLLGVCRAAGGLAPEEHARLVVVVDEAHNFVPESFVINDWDLKAKSQDTSMVLMESRKFGLGFVIVSQRTAMVTKSALSQCNTVFAFQAVDQTGLDYLEGLCGRTLAQSLPTLPHRTAIAMGQALTSNAPVVTFIDEAEVVVS